MSRIWIVSVVMAVLSGCEENRSVNNADQADTGINTPSCPVSVPDNDTVCTGPTTRCDYFMEKSHCNYLDLYWHCDCAGGTWQCHHDLEDCPVGEVGGETLCDGGRCMVRGDVTPNNSCPNDKPTPEAACNLPNDLFCHYFKDISHCGYSDLHYNCYCHENRWQCIEDHEDCWPQDAGLPSCPATKPTGACQHPEISTCVYYLPDTWYCTCKAGQWECIIVSPPTDALAAPVDGGMVD